MMRIVTAFLATAALGVAIASPEAEFSVPVIGYVYDSTAGQVRPLTGTPGSALAGAGLDVGRTDHAAISRDGSFALVPTKDGEALTITRLTATGMVSIVVADVPAWFDRAALSADEGAAALYSKDCGCVRIVSGLRTEPLLERTVALPDGSELRALAASNRGDVLAISTQHGKVLVHSASSFEFPLSASALTLDARGERLLAVDAEARRTYIVSNLGASLPVIEEAPSPAPVAAIFGAGPLVLVADAEAGVVLWNTAAYNSQAIACLCRPSLIEATVSPGLYRLSTLERGTVWMLDLAAETPRTFFVPVRREAAAE